MLVVSDTSPICNLLLIGRLSILKDVYQNIIIPPRVHTELMELVSLGEDISGYLSAEWIDIKSPTVTDTIEKLLEELDEGEAEAIALAKELNADYLLIDERKGYNIADQMGITAIGLIGVLLNAKKRGYIHQVMPIIDDLREVAGFWISNKFYGEIRSLAAE